MKTPKRQRRKRTVKPMDTKEFFQIPSVRDNIDRVVLASRAIAAEAKRHNYDSRWLVLSTLYHASDWDELLIPF